jgi:multidrug efflux system outer membrane protein
LLPTINVVGNESKQDYTGIAGYIVTEQGKPAAPIVKRVLSKEDTVSIGISSWEIDFFGRIRSLKEAAQQQYFATEQARRAAQIMLISEVAGTYYALAADRENLKLAETTLETQQASYNLVKRRFECGVATELDLHRSETQVESARGDVSRYTQVVAQDLNALNFLIGKSAPEDLLASDLGAITPPKEISEGASSEVLLSRPDVIQAEDILKAANANIGAARAAFFPRISLTTAAGTASNELSGLFDAGTGVWSFAPQIALPILNTQIWHSARISKVDKELAVTQYEKAIQNAFKEVSDALAVRGTIDEQVSAQEALVKAVAETYRLSNIRYEKGADSYLSVLDAQRTHYAAQQGLVSLRLAKIANQVKLYAVLGGGFDKPDSEKQEQTGAETPKTK